MMSSLTNPPYRRYNYSIEKGSEMFDPIIFVLIFVWLFVWPGFFILKISKQPTGPEMSSLIFAISCALYAIPVTIGFYLGAPISYLVSTTLMVNFALFFAYLYKQPMPYHKGSPFQGINFRAVFFWLFLSAVIYLSFFKLLPLYIEGDGPYHMAHIRNIVAEGRLINEEAITLLDDQSKINPGYAYNLWYGIMALFSKYSGLDIIKIFRYINPLLAFLGATSVAFLANSFSDSKKNGLAFYTIVASVALTLMYRPVDPMIMYFPNRVGYLILLPLIVGTAIRYFDNKDPFSYLTAVGLIVTSSLIHNMTFFYSLLSIGGFAVIKIFSQKNKKEFTYRVAGLISTAIIISIPFMWLKLSSINTFWAIQSSNLLPNGSVQTPLGYYYTIRDLNMEYAVSLAIAGAVFAFYTLRRKKYPQWLLYALSVCGIIFITRQNPFVAPHLTKIISSSYVRRMFLLLPSALIIGGLFSEISKTKLGNIKTKIIYTSLALLLIFLPSFTTFQYLRKDYAYTITAGKRFNIIAKVGQFMNKNLPANSVIAADTRSSYFVPAYSNNLIVSTYSTHTSIYVNREEREADVEQIFKGTNHAERERILKKYGAEYLLVPVKYNLKSTRGPYYDGRELIKIIDKDKDFTLLYNDENYRLYKIDWSKGGRR